MEEISKNLLFSGMSSSSEDSHPNNITALVFSLIAQFGRHDRSNETDILAYNLSSLLLQNHHYINDTDLLEMLKTNLENQESRLSYATFVYIVVIYVINVLFLLFLIITLL